MLENVVFDERTRALDLDSDAKTENTRAAYPIEFIPNVVPGSKGGHPDDDHHADRRCVRRAAADREADARAGDVSLPLRLHRQGRRHRARRHRAASDVFNVLRRAVHGASSDRVRAPARQQDRRARRVSAGWSTPAGRGGPYGVGKRMSIAHTRAMVNAAIEGRIPGEFETEPFFGLAIPKSVPGVPHEVLNPRNAWADKAAYDEQARKLSQLFFDNFKRFEMHVSESVNAVAIRPLARS